MPIILCLDPGTAHTGIAVSYEGELANPLDTIYEKDLDKLVVGLLPFIVRFNPDKVILGTPEHGPLKSFAQDLGGRLKKVFSGEIIYFEEDLSSRKARHQMKEVGKTLVKRKQLEHQTAAAVILQEYLDSL